MLFIMVLVASSVALTCANPAIGREVDRLEVRCCDTDACRNQLETMLYDLASQNGMSAGYGHVALSSLVDPAGNYVGFLDGQIVNVISAINHDDSFSFMGTEVTLPQHWDKGFGPKVFAEAIKHCGNRLIGVYAAPYMVEWYQQHGFETAGTGSIYRKQNPGKMPVPEGSNPAYIVPVTDVDYNELNRFDRRYFPADRPQFLQSWLAHPKVASAVAYVKDGVIHGYGALRLCIGETVAKFGPLYADSLEVAEALAVAMMNALPAGIETVQIDTLDANPSVRVLAHKLGFTATEPSTLTVMYKNGRPQFDISGVYAYSSGALG